MRKTKIVCTLGPSTDDLSKLKQIMISGMDVARINMSHQSHEKHLERVNMIKKLREDLSLPTALLLDTKGPEIRIGKFKLSKVHIKKGQTFSLTTNDIIGDKSIVSVSFKDLANRVRIGTKILVDDGRVCFLVKKVFDNFIVCEALNDGFLSSDKGINIPDLKVPLPFISDKDFEDIKFAVEQNFDFIAASFTRNAEDIKNLRKILIDLGGANIKIIAKIENSEGIKNIDEIISVSDGIMVARGDLGVEIPFENIPAIQKKLIKKANNAGKHVITATQMLDSMMKNPRPTRAEVSDVANAIYDGTSALMLSGETAAGDYPIEAVKTMASIAEKAESDIDYKKRFFNLSIDLKTTITSAMSHATCTTAMDLGAAAIFTITESGQTAKFVSKYKPSCPIIAVTSNQTILRQLNLLWGVIPIFSKNEFKDLNQLTEWAIEVSYNKKLIKDGDLIVIAAGLSLKKGYISNFLKVHIMGNILISGQGITNTSVKGKLCICKTEEEALKKFKPKDILVIPETSDDIIDIINNASAIITENCENNSHAAIVGIALDKPVIIGAKNATKVLKEGSFVTVDSNRGIVYNSKED